MMTNLMIGLTVFFSLVGIALFVFSKLHRPRKTLSDISSEIFVNACKVVDSKKSVSKMPMPLYEMTSYADVIIDGVALDWRHIEWACERLNIVCVRGDTGRLFQVGRDTGVLLNIDGALLFGNVVITNIARTWQ
tara:strand:- start:110 stop:511 length:402 start_codon:yes stop_codon:yes gene_type:complete